MLRQRPERLSYLGLLGSRRKVERVRRELAARGAELAGVPFFGPVGMAIGADTPGEIAVSILAEIIAVRSGKLAPAASEAAGVARQTV